MKERGERDREVWHGNENQLNKERIKLKNNVIRKWKEGREEKRGRKFRESRRRVKLRIKRGEENKYNWKKKRENQRKMISRKCIIVTIIIIVTKEFYSLKGYPLQWIKFF